MAGKVQKFLLAECCKKHIAKIAYSCCFFLQSSKTNLHVESFKVTRCYQLPKYRRIFSVVSDIEGLSFIVTSPTLNQSNSKKLTWTHPKLWKLAWTSHCKQIAKNWEFQTVSDFVFLCSHFLFFLKWYRIHMPNGILSPVSPTPQKSHSEYWAKATL